LTTSTEEVIRIGPNSDRQREFLAASEDEVLYGGAALGGKRININTLIPTPTGWRRNGDLVDGDEVFSENGEVIKILKAHPIVISNESYRITFDDGSEIDADAGHLWLTYNLADLSSLTRRTDKFRLNRRSKRPSRITGNKSKIFSDSVVSRNKLHPPETKEPPVGSIKTTLEIFKTVKCRNRNNHAIPVTKALELPGKEFVIEPYLLGLWLGDGYSHAGTIGMMKDDLLDVVQSVRRDILNLRSDNQLTRKKEFYLATFDGLTTDLRRSNLYKNKHLPAEYLRASREQRLELLMGLMDTDGTTVKTGGVEFTNTNENIIDGVCELIVSLGWKCNKRKGVAKCNGKIYGDVWDIKWTPDDYVFKLKRKKDKQILARTRQTKFRYITKCEKIESCLMRCITVDNPTGLYLCGKEMVVTHNSYALVIEPLRHIGHKHFTGIIFRRTYPEIEGSILPHCLDIYPYLGADYHVASRTWRFPSGATIKLGFMQDAEDWRLYQGHQYCFQGFDELTTFTPLQFEMLRAWNRSKAEGIKPYRRMTTNPTGVSHAFVKKSFVDPCKPIFDGPRRWSEEAKMWWQPTRPGPRFYWTDPETGLRISRRFIPAKIFDNVDGLRLNPNIIATLLSLPLAKRKAYLEGSWDTFEGQFFSNLSPGINIIDPTPIYFPPPKKWKVMAGLDYGQRTVLEVQCKDHEGFVTNFLEVYTEQMTVEDRAFYIAKKLMENELYNIRIYYDTTMKIDLKHYANSKGTPIRIFQKIFKEIMGGKEPSWQPVSKKNTDNRKFRAYCNEAVRSGLNYVIGEGGKIVTPPKFRITTNCPHLIEEMGEFEHNPNSLMGLDFLDTKKDDSFDASKYVYIRHEPEIIRPEQETTETNEWYNFLYQQQKIKSPDHGWRNPRLL